MLFIFTYIYILYNMKRFSDFINEKLKVSKHSISNITLESLIDALKDFKDRNRIIYVDFNLREILGEYPEVLNYYGSYTDKNIIGNEIQQLGYTQIKSTGEDVVYIYFDIRIGDSIHIENTEELHDIFGEEILTKIYDYIVNH